MNRFTNATLLSVECPALDHDRARLFKSDTGKNDIEAIFCMQNSGATNARCEVAGYMCTATMVKCCVCLQL